MIAGRRLILDLKYLGVKMHKKFSKLKCRSVFRLTIEVLIDNSFKKYRKINKNIDNIPKSVHIHKDASFTRSIFGVRAYSYVQQDIIHFSETHSSNCFYFLNDS